MGLDVGVYARQVARWWDDVRRRAARWEELGIGSLWLYDHLYAPGLPQAPSLEGWTLAAALLAVTTRLRVGHLVLCNQFRHPALLAKMAATLDVVSAGRLDLGIGSGSYEPEHRQAGLPWGGFGERTARLAATLEILTRAFAHGVVDFDGRYHSV